MSARTIYKCDVCDQEQGGEYSVLKLNVEAPRDGNNHFKYLAQIDVCDECAGGGIRFTRATLRHGKPKKITRAVPG